MPQVQDTNLYKQFGSVCMCVCVVLVHCTLLVVHCALLLLLFSLCFSNNVFCTSACRAETYFSSPRDPQDTRKSTETTTTTPAAVVVVRMCV